MILIPPKESFMLQFAVRRRDPNLQTQWLADVDVAQILGIHRTTLWRWVDAGLVPQPIRIGKVTISPGRVRSRTSRWNRAEIELFVQSGSMNQLRQSQRQSHSSK